MARRSAFDSRNKTERDLMSFICGKAQTYWCMKHIYFTEYSRIVYERINGRYQT